jgi:hypothetical protein
MTHICYYRTQSSHYFNDLMNDEEVDKILEEKKFLIQELKDFMNNFLVSSYGTVQEG